MLFGDGLRSVDLGEPYALRPSVPGTHHRPLRGPQSKTITEIVAALICFIAEVQPPPPPAVPGRGLLAAWFPDPDDPDRERWWDGERWTDARRDSTADVDLAPNSNWVAASRLTFGATSPDIPSRLAFGVIAMGLGIVVGTRLSWLRATPFRVELKITGTGPWFVGGVADSLWVLLVGLGVAVSGATMWLSRWRAGVLLVVASSAVSAAITIASLLHVQHYFRAHPPISPRAV